MSLQTEAATYTRKDSFNFNKLSQSLPDAHAPLTMEDRKLSARGRNLLFGITGGDAGKSAPTNKPAYEPLERKSSLKGFHTTPSLGSFGSMQDLLRHTNSLKNMSIFDQTMPQSPAYNKSNNMQSKIQPYFGSLAIDDNSIMDRQINRKPAESDSDDDSAS